MSQVRSSDQTVWLNRRTVLAEMGFLTYKEYLAGDLWQTIRTEVLAVGHCLLCYQRRATQVHHLSYDRATMEGTDRSKLVAICGICHQQVEFREGGEKRAFTETQVLCIKLLKKMESKIEAKGGLLRWMKRAKQNRIKRTLKKRVKTAAKRKQLKLVKDQRTALLAVPGRCRRCGSMAKKQNEFCRPCLRGDPVQRRKRPRYSSGKQQLGIQLTEQPKVKKNNICTLEDVHDSEPAAKLKISLFGLRLETVYHWKGNSCSHWLLNRPDGRRVIDYWPTTGRWWCGRTKEGGNVSGWQEALSAALARKDF